MSLYFLLLFILGSIFGSFSTVLIERWKHKKSGILFGRSECPHCHHILGARELIPFLSYLIQFGRCLKCKTKIPIFYPFCELILGTIFLLMGVVNISLGFEPISWTLLILLILGFATGVYMIYDIRYMEIPDQILVPGIVFYIILFILGYFSEEMYIHFFDAWSYQNYESFLIDHLRSALIIYTFFFLQILIPGGAYLLRGKKYREFFELLVSYCTFPILLIFGRYSSEPEKEEVELPSWIGGGDLRVAIFIGLTLGTIHTLSTLLFAYCIGAIVGIILLLRNGSQAKSQIPFGPFLGIGWILSLIFYTEILNFI